MDCMDAQASPLHRGGSAFGKNRTAVATAVLAFGAAFLLLGILVIGRRVLGAADRPAPVMLLLAAGVIVGVYSWVSRRIWRETVSPRGDPAASRVLDAVVGFGPSVVIVMLTLALSLPMKRYVDWLVWTPLWVADVLWRMSYLAGEPPQDPDPNGVAPPVADDRVKDVAFLDESEAVTGAVLQQWTRVRTTTDCEAISGTLRADFAPGQRTAEVYVAFCPSFDGLPTVEVEQSDGPAARISVGRALPHGARIDVRLNEPARAESHVQVDMYACGACHP